MAPEAMTASQREACQRLWRLREKRPKASRAAKLASSRVVRMGWVERVVERAISVGLRGSSGCQGMPVKMALRESWSQVGPMGRPESWMR